MPQIAGVGLTADPIAVRPGNCRFLCTAQGEDVTFLGMVLGMVTWISRNWGYYDVILFDTILYTANKFFLFASRGMCEQIPQLQVQLTIHVAVMMPKTELCRKKRKEKVSVIN